MPAFLLARAAMPRLIERGGGAFVGVSARAALRPFAGRRRLHRRQGGAAGASSRRSTPSTSADGIRCNAILPSVIDTPANREAEPDADHSKWVQPAAIAKVDPLPRLGGLGADQRRRRAGLRPRVDSASAAPADLLRGRGVLTAPIGAPISGTSRPA